MRGQGDGEAERRGTEPTTSTLNSSPPSQPREATGAAAAEREPRDTRAQQRRHCQSPSLLMLTGHPQRHLECASRHCANPMPCSFPSFFPEWSPLESSRHINSHTTTRLAGYCCTGCALHNPRPCGSGSLAGVQHSSPDPDEEVSPFAVARTRVGTFYLISEEIEGHLGSGDAYQQINCLKLSSTPNTGRGLIPQEGRSCVYIATVGIRMCPAAYRRGSLLKRGHFRL